MPKAKKKNASKFSPKRSRAQREADLLTISELWLEEWTYGEIRDELNKRHAGVYSLSRSAIQQDVAEIVKRWKKETAANVGNRVEKEKRKLDRVEKEAWKEYRASQGDFIKKEASADPATGKTVGQVKVTTEQRIGDARFLEVIARCHDRRAKLQGLNAPDRLDATLSGPGGGPIESLVTSAISDDDQKRAVEILKASLQAQAPKPA